MAGGIGLLHDELADGWNNGLRQMSDFGMGVGVLWARNRFTTRLSWFLGRSNCRDGGTSRLDINESSSKFVETKFPRDVPQALLS